MAAQFSYPFARRARLMALGALLRACLSPLAANMARWSRRPDPNAPPKPAHTSSNPNNLGALSKPSIPPIVPPKQPFFLDFLLK